MEVSSGILSSVSAAVRAATCLCLFAAEATAQHRAASTTEPQLTPEPSTVVVVAGKSYAKSGVYRWLFGNTYRDLWTTPIRVPVFDWHGFAGGLRPTKAGGGLQT